jgi:hypothetical protein
MRSHTTNPSSHLLFLERIYITCPMCIVFRSDNNRLSNIADTFIFQVISIMNVLIQFFVLSFVMV